MRIFTTILLIAAIATGLDLAFAVYMGPSEDDFYAMDKAGGYHFGYNDGRIARQEIRTPEGVIRGAYSYVDANGQIQTISYTADKHNGFLASGSLISSDTEIPETTVLVENPPAGIVGDTPEVVAARAQHLEEVRRIRLGLGQSMLPMPVGYTAEVAAARAEHINRAILPAVHYHPDYLPYVGL